MGYAVDGEVDDLLPEIDAFAELDMRITVS